VSKAGLIGLIESLENTIKKLQPRLRRENWAEYYDHTNYSTEAFEHKKHLVSEVVREVKPRVVWDLGANTGLFSRVAAQSAGCLVISADIDPEAVEINYHQMRGERLPLLPLVLDLTNPSPGVGWNNRERMAFLERGPVDLVMALALIHHLAIGNNLPLDEIASVFASMGKYLLIEFVPKEDSQVQRLLRSREDIFGEYHLEGFRKAFEPYFVVHKKLPIAGSKRLLFLLESRNY
jgi:ribosomal protein L11 methylase PrmA